MILSELLERLSSLRGLSGWEESVRTELQNLLHNDAASMTVDTAGNLLLSKRGLHPASVRVLFAAHMDECGFLVSRIEEDGTLRLTPAGRVTPAVSAGRMVEIGSNRIPGVLGCKPIHLLDKEERGKYIGFDSLRADIGAESKAEAEKKVSVGDPVTFAGKWEEIGKLVCGQALESRTGCAILAKMVQDVLPHDCSFVFSVQSQTGFTGAQTAAASIKPDLVFVIDAVPAQDYPGVPEQEQGCHIGAGPVLSILDKGSISDRKLLRLAGTVANRDHIPFQYSSVRQESSEARAYQRSGEGCPVLTVSLPVRYPYTASSMVSLEDMGHLLRLLKALLEEIA